MNAHRNSSRNEEPLSPPSLLSKEKSTQISMPLFKSSFAFDESKKVCGVLEPVFTEEDNGFDLLDIVGVDKTKIKAGRGKWFVSDLAYFDDLERLLDDDDQLESVSPYEDFLRESQPQFSQAERDSLFNWSKFPKTTKPFKYQIEAVTNAILDHDGRSIVALKTGSGKTLIGVLFIYYYLVRVREAKKALIICPASKTLDWIRDYVKWTGRSAKNITAITMQTATIRAQKQPSYFDQFDVAVVDECHHLKNIDTIASKSLKPILHNIMALLMLSGTPQLNRNSELFNQFSMVRPEIFNDYKTFTSRYSGGHVDLSGKWDARGSAYLWELNILSCRVMFRRDVVTTTTTKVRNAIHKAPTSDQKRAILRFANGRRKLAAKVLRARTPQDRLQAQRMLDAYITKMHRAAGKWKSDDPEGIINHILEKHPNERIAFFADHINVINAFKQAIDARNLGESVILTGKSKQEERQAVVDRMADPDDPVRFGFFTPCMKEGVTMSPGTTVEVIFEIGWTPSEMLQKEDRIFRIGTTEEVNIYWVFCQDSYDYESLGKILSKAEEIKAVVGTQFDLRFDTETWLLPSPEAPPSTNTEPQQQEGGEDADKKKKRRKRVKEEGEEIHENPPPTKKRKRGSVTNTQEEKATTIATTTTTTSTQTLLPIPEEMMFPTLEARPSPNEEMPDEKRMRLDDSSQGETSTSQVETAPVQMEVVREESAPVQMETVQEETAPVQTETLQEETAPVQTETLQEESAPVQTETVQEESAPVQTETLREESAPVQTETVQEESAPVQTETVQEESAPVQTETVQEESALVQTEAVQEESAPVQTEAVQEESASVQMEVVQEGTAPVQMETAPVQEGTSSVQMETAPVQEETASVQMETVQEETSPVQTEAVQEETSPVQEEMAPVQMETVQEETAQEDTVQEETALMEKEELKQNTMPALLAESTSPTPVRSEIE